VGTDVAAPPDAGNTIPAGSDTPDVSPAPPRKRAAIYAVLPAEGARANVAKLEAFARERGFEVVVRYVEDPAQLRRRPRRSRLRARALRGAFDVVVVPRFDVLAGTRAAVLRVARELRALGVDVVSRGSPAGTDLLNPAVRWRHRGEEDRLARARHAFDEKRERLEPCGRCAPYGWTAYVDETGTKRLVRNEYEQGVIRAALHGRASGWTLDVICKTLDRLGVRNREGRRFQRRSISRLLARHGVR
jgi:DNA invertase Pin-like site-specific DNA recombinase